MPNKKKPFTKHNSTKFVLCTDGRDADGNKITENVLVPVTDHVPGNSLIISRIADLYAKSNESKTSKEAVESNVSKEPTKRSKHNKEPNLQNILNQMECISEDEDEEFENVKAKFKNMNFFDTLGSSGCNPSTVQIEIEEGSDFSEELGQFSDADSDFDFDNFVHENALTSSKLNCPDNIKILNEGFDKIFNEYDDNQIGALDDEEICGVFSTENEQIQNFIQTPLNKDQQYEEFDEDLKEKTLLYSEMEKEEKLVEVTFKRPLEFDCESILSTYSNKYNHPTVIKEESSKVRKIKIPNNPLRKSLTKSKLKQLDTVSESDEESDEMSVATSFNVRAADETPEERRERKRLFKEAKRESRMLKKENKLAFKDEKKRQICQAMNVQRNRGMRLI